MATLTTKEQIVFIEWSKIGCAGYDEGWNIQTLTQAWKRIQWAEVHKTTWQGRIARLADKVECRRYAKIGTYGQSVISGLL